MYYRKCWTPVLMLAHRATLALETAKVKKTPLHLLAPTPRVDEAMNGV